MPTEHSHYPCLLYGMPMITFGLRDCSEYNDLGRKNWWESMRPWFSDKGYTLYQTVYEDESIRDEPSFVFLGETQFPYAHSGGCPERNCSLYRVMHPRVVYAQDSLFRHVAIKAIVTNSDEYKILCLLRQLQLAGSVGVDNFPCIMPIIDMLPFGAHHFAVMPRTAISPWFMTMEELLDCIRCELVGLVFLHKNRIFHRDINGLNILVNHFVCDEVPPSSNEIRRTLRSKKQLLYALNDFDLAILLPADTNIKTCRLPLIDSFPGLDDKPLEVLQGEIDFNPFAYDVASLGIEFCYQYKHLCPVVPLLAPLISGMVTHDVAQRFTAEEALAFLDEHWENLSRDDLNRIPERVPGFSPWNESDWWVGIPSHLARKWERYRPKPEPFFVTSVLRPLCERRWGLYLVHYIRLLFSPFSLFRYGRKAFQCQP